MSSIHHATVKFVAKFGLEIVEADGKFRLRDAAGLLSEDSFASPGEITEELRANGTDIITWATPKAAPGLSSGVMALSFHREYSMNPDGPGCGDDLDLTLRNETRLFDDEGRDLDAMDRAKLEAIARANGVWRDAWDTLNNGMARMNASNRLRALLRNSPEQISIGSKTGRFGIEQVVKVKKAKAPKAAKVEAVAAA